MIESARSIAECKNAVRHDCLAFMITKCAGSCLKTGDNHGFFMHKKIYFYQSLSKNLNQILNKHASMCAHMHSRAIYNSVSFRFWFEHEKI